MQIRCNEKKSPLSLLHEMLNSEFDLDVGIQINNSKVLRERCHQTEYICVAQTHFDSGNIKRNCFKNLVKKGSLLTALMMLKLRKMNACAAFELGPPGRSSEVILLFVLLGIFLMRMSFSGRNRAEARLAASFQAHSF